MQTSPIRSVYIYSSFYPPHPLFPLYNHCMWCLSLDVKFIRGRSVLPLAGCAAAVPFNCTAWFLAWLGMNVYFYAAALIYSPIGIMVIICTELGGHMWIIKKLFFFNLARHMKIHKEMMVYLSPLAAANVPYLLVFFSMSRQALKCSLFIYILNTGIGWLYAPPTYKSSSCPLLCFTLIPLTNHCNYERSSPFRLSQLFFPLPSCYLFLKAFLKLQCVNRDDEVALFHVQAEPVSWLACNF